MAYVGVAMGKGRGSPRQERLGLGIRSKVNGKGAGQLREGGACKGGACDGEAWFRGKRLLGLGYKGWDEWGRGRPCV